MHKYDLLDITLSLFDGGTAAAGGGDGAGAAAPAQGDDGAKGGSQALPAPTRRGKSGDTKQVLYGKQADPAVAGDQAGANGGTPPVAGEGTVDGQPGTTVTSDTLEARKKAYREMVEGEFKDIYTEDTQRIIDRRFREVRNLEEQISRTQPVLSMLMQRYGIADGDPAKLMQAVENDDAYWSQAAEEAGMSVEQYKKFQQLQRQNAELVEAQRQSQAQQRAQAQLHKWYDEAEQVRQMYPSFDLTAEVKNPQFLSMLRAGVPVQHAYEVIHMDDIKAGVAAMQAKATEKQVVGSIRAKGARPAENGIAAQSGFTIKDDVTKLTKQDRAEIARRAARGDTITF